MNSSDTRVQTYLDDLARMLSDLDPGERDDVLAGIREHLDATLADHPDDPAAVDAALLRLGPPERVAAEARAGQPPRAPATLQVSYRSPVPSTAHPTRTRVAALASLAPLVLLSLGALLGRADGLLRDPRAAWSASTALIPHPSEVMLLLVLGFPLWLIAVVVALVGRELRTRTALFLALLGPATFLAVFASALFQDPLVVSTPLSLAALAAVVIWAAVTARRVWRETRT